MGLVSFVFLGRIDIEGKGPALMSVGVCEIVLPAAHHGGKLAIRLHAFGKFGTRIGSQCAEDVFARQHLVFQTATLLPIRQAHPSSNSWL